jgi:cholesterol oxidase
LLKGPRDQDNSVEERDLSGNGFDFDVIVIGSGFGRSLAAVRAIEKGYRVEVLKSGRRCPQSGRVQARV